MKITKTIEVEIDLDQAAEWFAGISDDDMARFFCKVAAKALEWPNASIRPQMMWAYVGEHLASCKCSTEEGRSMLRDIVYFMEKKLAETAASRGDRHG